ncbi:MAG: molecular chaperone DnaJ [Candidatus Nanohaloarchaea archaeon]
MSEKPRRTWEETLVTPAKTWSTPTTRKSTRKTKRSKILFFNPLSGWQTIAREYYELLGVSEDASQEEIKKAYREKAKKYHPDSGGEEADEEKFKKINKAYDVLSDEEKRKKYDRFGKEGVEGHAQRGQRRAASSFQDLFEQIFGGGRSRRRRGKDARMQADITLEEAYSGVEKTYRVERRKQCEECDGSGAENGNTETCPECGGDGRVTQVQRTPFGRSRSVKECGSCSGRGEVPEEECSSCSGEGLVEEEETVEVEIPAGVKTEQKLRIAGMGHEDRDGNPGDLYVIVNVEEHDTLERKGNDLYTTLKIGVGDAVLGTTAEVYSPSGTLEVEIPEGTQPGQVLRLRGKGMPDRRRMQGDLLVKIDVEIPEDVTEEQREALEELRVEEEEERSFFETVKDLIN